jgi:hypothetical protein
MLNPESVMPNLSADRQARFGISSELALNLFQGQAYFSI